MRISDWSSDVCSSDLLGPLPRKDETISYQSPLPAGARFGFASSARKNWRRLSGAMPKMHASSGFIVLSANPPRAASPREEAPRELRSEEHTSELQSLMRISYAVLCLKKKKRQPTQV